MEKKATCDRGDCLPNSSTKGVPHKITGWSSDYILTQSYGASTDSSAVESIPIPNDGIMLKINSADVTVTTTTDMSAFTQTTIVIEYTKN